MRVHARWTREPAGAPEGGITVPSTGGRGPAVPDAGRDPTCHPMPKSGPYPAIAGRRRRTLVRRFLPAAVAGRSPSGALRRRSVLQRLHERHAVAHRARLPDGAGGRRHADGRHRVTATTAPVAGTNPGVQRMVFWLDGQYLLTDFSPPYTFTLPTSKFRRPASPPPARRCAMAPRRRREATI